MQLLSVRQAEGEQAFMKPYSKIQSNPAVLEFNGKIQSLE